MLRLKKDSIGFIEFASTISVKINVAPKNATDFILTPEGRATEKGIAFSNLIACNLTNCQMKRQGSTLTREYISAR